MANSPVQLVNRARRFLVEELWTVELGPGSGLGRLLRVVQLSALICRGFIDDKLLLRASALTYITSLSIIPILVVALSVVDWLGLSKSLVVLGVNQFLAGSPDAVDRILDLVENAKVGAFGSVSGAIFFATAILSLRHVEETMNQIWGALQGRSWIRRFSNYLAVMVVVPLALGVIISLSSSLGVESLGTRLESVPMGEALRGLMVGVGPTGFLFLCFGFAYYVLPNTAVRPLSATIGAAIAAVLFGVAQWAYVTFSVGVARYDSLFGGFAIVPLLLVWIYVSWSIVLFGAEVAYAHQHLARYRREARDAELEPAEREALGLRMILEVARAFRDGWPPQSAEALANRLGSSLRLASEMLVRFQEAGIVAGGAGADGELRYQLGRDAREISVGDVFRAMRGTRPERGAPDGDSGSDGALQSADALLCDVSDALEPIWSRSLAELSDRLPRQEAEEPRSGRRR